MREDEILIKELDEATDKAIETVQVFLEAFGKIGEVDPGTPNPEDEEEINKHRAFLIEKDRRRCMILRRILMEYGNLLFI